MPRNKHMFTDTAGFWIIGYVNIYTFHIFIHVHSGKFDNKLLGVLKKLKVNEQYLKYIIFISRDRERWELLFPEEKPCVK